MTTRIPVIKAGLGLTGSDLGTGWTPLVIVFGLREANQSSPEVVMWRTLPQCLQ